jgi:SAM-dependent methyltransferase
VSRDHATVYDRSFYSLIDTWSRDSTEQIVPIVTSLIRPASVVDLGCGTGTWLAEFARHGVEKYLGIDGAHVDRSMLKFDASRFVAADLTAPLSLGSERFDLALSLEVAEHLPERYASGLVDSLVSLAPAVLFSAAVPLQGGANHVNERWQTYWAQLFAERQFVAIDAIRPRVWNNRKVASFYAQNMLCYVHEGMLRERPVLQSERERTRDWSLDIVHPRHYLVYASNQHLSLSGTLKLLPGLFAGTVRRRLRRLAARFKGATRA